MLYVNLFIPFFLYVSQIKKEVNWSQHVFYQFTNLQQNISSESSVKSSCDFVISSVRNSFLNYSIQETPFSLYLTIRKSFAKSSANSDQIRSCSVQNVLLEHTEVETLTNKLKAAQESNMILQNSYEEAVNDSEKCYERINELESKVEGLKEKINHYE